VGGENKGQHKNTKLFSNQDPVIRDRATKNKSNTHPGGQSILPTEGMFSMPKLSADVDGRPGQMHLHKVDNTGNLADLLCGDLRSSPKGVEHLSLVVCGQMGSGKSTIAGQLLVKMGTVSVSDRENIQHQLEDLGGGLDFEPALFMDTTVDERLEGHSMACTTNEFYTDRSLPDQALFTMNLGQILTIPIPLSFRVTS
jgi:hypothetical protein